MYCPGGVRHIGGASLTRAFAWNVGTCRPDIVCGQSVVDEREFLERSSPREVEYRCGARGQTVS